MPKSGVLRDLLTRCAFYKGHWCKTSTRAHVHLVHALYLIHFCLVIGEYASHW